MGYKKEKNLGKFGGLGLGDMSTWNNNFGTLKSDLRRNSSPNDKELASFESRFNSLANDTKNAGFESSVESAISNQFSATLNAYPGWKWTVKNGKQVRSANNATLVTRLVRAMDKIAVIAATKVVTKIEEKVFYTTPTNGKQPAAPAKETSNTVVIVGFAALLAGYLMMKGK